MKSRTKNKTTSSVSATGNTSPAVNDEALIAVLQALPVGVIIFSEKNILFANKAAIKVLKPTRAQEKTLAQHSIFDFLIPDFHKRVKANNKKLLQGEEFVPAELKIRNYKDEIIDVEVKSNAITFNGQKVIQTVFTEVSERVKYTEELTHHKENLELITENANDIIFFYTYHPKPKYIYISPSIKKVLGYTSKDFYNDSLLGSKLVTDKKAYAEFENGLSKLQKNNKLKHTSILFQYKTKSGKLIWLEDNYSPIYENDGSIKFILGISRDVTREKTYQLELEHKWNNYQNLLDTSPMGIFIHDNGICLYCNQTALDILEEKSKAKLIGKNLITYILPEQREPAIKRMNRAFKGEELSDESYKIKTATKKVIDVELKTVPFIFNGKKCVQTIISNISAEKKLAKETLRAEIAEDMNKQLLEEISYRKKIQHELVTQSTKYEAIFNDTSHLIWTINRKLEVTSFNKNYYQYIKSVFNFELKIGNSIRKIGSVTNKNLKLNFWIEKYNRFFNNKENNDVEFFEVQNTSPNGDVFYREIFLHPIRNNKGEVEEIAVIGHDVTERKKSEQKILEQSAKLSAIFNSGTQLIWTLDRNYHFTSFNENFSDSMYKVHGVRPVLDKKEVFNPHKGTGNEYIHDWWLNKYEQVFKTQKSVEFTIEQTEFGTQKHYRQVFINPILNKGEVVEISCLSYDITELKYLQSESLRLEQKLSSIFDSSTHLIWTVNRKNDITSYNKNFASVFEKKYNQTLVINTRPADLLKGKVKQDYCDYWYPLYEKVFQGNKLKFERKEMEGDQVFYREVYLSPIRNENGEIIEVACLAHDITENKNFESKILNQSAKLQAIFESGNQLMWTINRDMQLTSFNQNYANAIFDLYHFYPQENKSIRELSANKTKPFEPIWDEYYAVAFSGRQVEFTSERVLMNGEKVFRQYFLYPIKNHNHEVIEVSGLGFDITENKLNEVKLIQSLKEKEVLLKEVHHRVKNNMQVISSILNLQSSYVKDAYAFNLLKECQNRVKSMAFIHESLYQTKNFESVNFSEYITTLSKNLIHTYSVNSQKIKLILTLDDLFLNLDTSIPCGLIINEIISNSLKYAFPDNRDGIIFVTLKVNKNRVKIEAGDNGIGMPENIDIKNTQTLGLQLVDTLIEQINGSLELDSKKGTKFSIDFKI
jgi:PAS domain S-box-containing protein